MKRNLLLTSVILIVMLGFTLNSNGQTVLFEDNFDNAEAWNITSGQLIVSNNIASTQGDDAMTLAFASFTEALSTGYSLELTFNSNDVAAFANVYWAGVSLFENGVEQIFIGSPGGTPSWGIGGALSPVTLTETSENVSVKFTYNFGTGDWMLDVGGEVVSGTIASEYAFDQVRIGADANNRCDIAVSNLSITKSIPVESVSINETDQSIIRDETVQLTATALPAEASNQTVTWSSSEPDIASVSETGLVTGMAAGTTTITVTTTDGGLTDNVTITVESGVGVFDNINTAVSNVYSHRGNIYVDLAESDLNSMLVVYNLSGQVAHSQILDEIGLNQVSVDASNSIYLVRIINKNSSKVTKVVIQN